MALAQKIIPHYTYEDYLHWEGRWELIEGHPIAMSPLPSPQHQRITVELMVAFHNALKKSNCNQCKIYDPIDYKIKDDTIVAPDILIVCKAITKKFLDFSPALVIEVLSPSTAVRDRHTKYEIYQEQGIKYYLIVDIDKRSIEIYELSNSAYTLKTNNVLDFNFLLDDGCSVKVDFTELDWE
ncbi:MAG: Uma2 family endonuclease [Bacteroidetes bacterium]|nr:Uma2 family endonuclease [Bacteroidota bacterium]